METKKSRSAVTERPVGEVLRGGGKDHLSRGHPLRRPARTQLNLHRWRSRTVVWRTGRWLALSFHRIRHEPDVDPAVRGAAFASLVVFDRLILAEADQINLVRRNVVLRAEILD